MRVGGGGAKGAQFEREVCAKLSLWVSGGKRQDLFWRSSMSGGRATVKNKRGVRIDQGGDITAVDAAGYPLTERFCIECKHVRDYKLDRFILEGVGPLMLYWKQAVRQARLQHKQPLLIARQNRYPVIYVANFNPDYRVPGDWWDTSSTVRIGLFGILIKTDFTEFKDWTRE